jgi:translation elongation factor EF-4
MQSMVFAGVFPLDPQDFQKLEEAIGRVRRPLAFGPGNES